MDNLEHSKTNLTPLIDFNAETGILRIEGPCIPENSHLFFVPIIKWIEDLFGNNVADKSRKFNLEITCEYYNSSSAKMLVYLFDKIAEIQHDGYNFSVTWYCSNEDPDLMDSIMDFISITKVKIEIVHI